MLKWIMFLFGIIFVSIPVSAQEEGDIEQFIIELDKKIPQALIDFNVPGAAIAIIEKGALVLQKGYGFADIEKERKVDTETGFNIGSMSKTVAAWGVMKLVQEGIIDLDAPAEKYLTRWHIPKSEYDTDEVIIRRLLSHTAGLSLHGYPGWNSNDTLPAIEASLNGKNNGPGRVQIIMEPGTKYQYSGGGYTILQLIIEEVTGQKFEDYMQEQVLNPLGMTNSSYKIDEAIMAGSASEYDAFGEKIDFELFTAQAAAGLHTTIEDFTHFAMANLYKQNDNPVLRSNFLKMMMKPARSTNGKYGLGYELKTRKIEKGLIGHSGSNTGWQSLFFIDPKSNDGFIIFTNGGAGWNIANLLFCECIAYRNGNWPKNDCSMKVPISNKINQLIETEGLKNIQEEYYSLKKEYADKYNFSGNQLNILGYHYLERKELEKAIAVFSLNMDAFPYVWNVYDSYGEALLEQGKKEEAIVNYTKSILLNPDNEHGKMILKDLGVSTDDIPIKLPIEYLKQLEGEYISTSGTKKVISYVVKNGELFRFYKERNQSIKLVPIANNEFVYLGLGLHVVFDTSESNSIILAVPDEGKFKKVK